MTAGLHNQPALADKLNVKKLSLDFLHKSFFKQYLIHNWNSLSFLRRLAQNTAQGEEFIEEIPLILTFSQREKELSILILLPINDHLLIYETDLFEWF